MDNQSPREECAICLGSMKAGGGKALFTAECNHSFHFNCIASNVNHGNRTCPTCRSTWNNIPMQAPSNNRNGSHDFTPLRINPSPPEFADDEPITYVAGPSNAQAASDMVIKALPGYAALSSSDSTNSFPILISILAPDVQPEASNQPGRAPLDLVAVLDVSSSMSGQKLRLVKEAMNFVVENLSSSDRFSIVCFSTNARRVTPLPRMSDQGKTNAISAIDSLRTQGKTDIIAGLRLGLQVLEERRERNPVASIILLSDGQDNRNGGGRGFTDALEGLRMPRSSPVHTFGFGSDHDAAALHAVSEVSSAGTFSFVESIEAVKEAFARCIGGLLSVVSQEAEVTLDSASPGSIKIESISSGRYQNKLDQLSGLSGLIHVGDLYAEEVKKFLVYLAIPPIETEASSSSAFSSGRTQLLLNVKCSYVDPVTKETITSGTHMVEIRRREVLNPEDRQLNLEVERERSRIMVAESIAKAQVTAEKGDYAGARAVLDAQRENLRVSTAEFVQDQMYKELEAELVETSERMSNRAVYERDGRGYVLAGMSAERAQRPTTQASTRRRRMRTGGARLCCFSTKAQNRMVSKAQAQNKVSPGSGSETPSKRTVITRKMNRGVAPPAAKKSKN